MLTYAKAGVKGNSCTLDVAVENMQCIGGGIVLLVNGCGDECEILARTVKV